MPKNFAMYHNIGVENSLPDNSVSSVRFQYFCGTMTSENIVKFQRIAYRLTRGNVYMLTRVIPEKGETPVPEAVPNVPAPQAAGNTAPQTKPVSGIALPTRSIFFMAFQLGGSDVVKTKLVRLCQAFDSSMYNLPTTYQEFDSEIERLTQELQNSQEVCNETKHSILKSLNVFAAPHDDNDFSYLVELKMRVLREKNIYNEFNKLRLRDNIFYGKLWVPREYEGRVKMALDLLHKKSNFARTDLEYKDHTLTKYTPPTYFKLNDFTMPFQEIVDTYGVPRYQEVNPALFTIITFPYLFGVMFGDIGHGGLLFAFGILLVVKDKELKDTPIGIFSVVRYLFFLMGLFSFFNGIIYNDFFGIAMRFFGSCYDNHLHKEERHCTYMMGIDPAWY